MTEVMRLDRIRKSHAGRVLFDDVSLSLHAGNSVALVGPSGSGKTTLLRIIAGLDTPEAGEVWIGGRLATQAATLHVRPHQRGIGFVFQDLALWPHMTVAESLLFVVESASPAMPHTDHQRTIDETLRLVQIDGLRHRYPHQLSGGEQQRAAFARALVHRPPLLLLDEPFSNLDADLRQDMRKSLGELHDRLRFAMVFVTHDRDEATTVADRTLTLMRGDGVRESTPRRFNRAGDSYAEDD